MSRKRTRRQRARMSEAQKRRHAERPLGPHSEQWNANIRAGVLAAIARRRENTGRWAAAWARLQTIFGK